MSISRAQSWPLLLGTAAGAVNRGVIGKESSQIGRDTCYRDKKKPVEGTEKKGDIDVKRKFVNEASSPQVQARKLLCRHYYPEGGWGWVIVVVGTLVHLLGSGLQLSAPAILTIPASIKFHHQPIHTAGKMYRNVLVVLFENDAFCKIFFYVFPRHRNDKRIKKSINNVSRCKRRQRNCIRGLRSRESLLRWTLYRVSFLACYFSLSSRENRPKRVPPHLRAYCVCTRLVRTYMFRNRNNNKKPIQVTIFYSNIIREIVWLGCFVKIPKRLSVFVKRLNRPNIVERTIERNLNMHTDIISRADPTVSVFQDLWKQKINKQTKRRLIQLKIIGKSHRKSPKYLSGIELSLNFYRSSL